MIAVIGELQMENGYTAYPIVYFAKKKPSAKQLADNWPHNPYGIYSYTTEKGKHEWIEETDSWDFNLLPWLKREKLKWCEPGSKNTKISKAPPETSDV